MSRHSLVLAALLVTSLARADGLSFDGSEPRFPHAWLELDASQRARLGDGLGGAGSMLELNRSQRAATKCRALAFASLIGGRYVK